MVNKFFQPLALWQAQCSGTVSGGALPAGHIIPEELPLETARAMTRFLDNV